MNSPSLFALSFSIFGISTRLLVYTMGWESSASTQLYFLFLLLAIFFGIRSVFRQDTSSSIVQLFKVGARSSALFSLTISGFTYIFYRFIDTNYFLGQIELRLDEARTLGYTQEQIDRLVGNLDIVFSLSTHIPTTLIGFTLIGLAYSIMLAFLFKKIPLFKRI